MRLIDADALIKNMRGKSIDHIEEYRAITIIYDAPSIDVVLCSACRFGDDHYIHSEDSHRFEWCYEFNDVDGYCPFGKKRSEREGE